MTFHFDARYGLVYLHPMARQARSVTSGEIYHVINRGNFRMRVFGKPADYLEFMRLMEEARRRTGMRILAFCLMPNHWHMALWPRKAKDLSAFVGWLSNTHVRRWRQHPRNLGKGHLYQGRFKSFPAQSGKRLYELLRYVEGNARRAQLTAAAEAWPYSSLYTGEQRHEDRVQRTPWPMPRPRNWLAMVNEPIETTELDRLRLHVQRNRPYGNATWTLDAAKRMGLEWTIRPRGRPSANDGKQTPEA